MGFEGLQAQEETEPVNFIVAFSQLETSVSDKNPVVWHNLLEDRILSEENFEKFIAKENTSLELLGLLKSILQQISLRSEMVQQHPELIALGLQISSVILRVEIQDNNQGAEICGNTVTFVAHTLLENSVRLTEIFNKSLRGLKDCILCSEKQWNVYFHRVIVSSLRHILYCLQQLVWEHETSDSLSQQILFVAYFGIDAKELPINYCARALLQSLFETHPSFQEDILFRVFLSIIEPRITVHQPNSQNTKCENADAIYKESIATILRLLNTCGCYFCGGEKYQLFGPHNSTCRILQNRNAIETSSNPTVFVQENAGYNNLIRNCESLVNSIRGWALHMLSSDKKRAILNFIESILYLYADLQFPSCFILIVTLFYWSIQEMSNAKDPLMRELTAEILTRIAMRLLHLRHSHQACKNCTSLTDCSQLHVVINQQQLHSEDISYHSAGCWATILGRTSKKVEIVFDNCSNLQNPDFSSQTSSKIVNSSLKNAVECSIACCSLTKTGPSQTIEKLFSVLPVGTPAERYRILNNITNILRTDVKLLLDFSWIDDAVIILCRDPSASVRTISLDLASLIVDIRFHSSTNFQKEKFLLPWSRLVTERLRDNNASVRKSALHFAKSILVFFASLRVNQHAASSPNKELLCDILSRINDGESGIHEACVECLEEICQYSTKEFSNDFGNSYLINEFYCQLLEAIKSLKSRKLQRAAVDALAKASGSGSPILERLLKYSMELIARTIKTASEQPAVTENELTNHYRAATLFLEVSCELDPEYAAPYERYMLSCLESSTNYGDKAVHAVAKVLDILSSLYESSPTGLEGFKRFFGVLENILINNLCPVIGDSAVRSVQKLWKIPSFRPEIDEILHELLLLVQKKTQNWTVTYDSSHRNTWKVTATLFVRISALSTFSSSQLLREPIRRAILWLQKQTVEYIRNQTQLTDEDSWCAVGLEALLLYSRVEASSVIYLNETVNLLLASETVAESLKLSVLTTLQGLLSEGLQQLNNEQSQLVHYTPHSLLQMEGNVLLDSITAIIQRLLPILVNLAFSPNTQSRQAVCSILCQSVCSGLILVVEVASTLFVFVLEEKATEIRERALLSLKMFVSDHQEILASRLVEGFYNTYRFWKKVHHENWTCLVDEGGSHLVSRFSQVFCLFPSTCIFNIVRIILDEIVTQDQDWKFAIFCAVSVVMADYKWLSTPKAVKRRRSVIHCEEIYSIVDKSNQLLATNGLQWLNECFEEDKTKQESAPSSQIIRLYAITLIRDEFLRQAEEYTKTGELRQESCHLRKASYWDDLLRFLVHGESQHILKFIHLALNEEDGLLNENSFPSGTTNDHERESIYLCTPKRSKEAKK